MISTPRNNRLISDDDGDVSAPSTHPMARQSGDDALPRRPRGKGGNGAYKGRRQMTAYIDTNLFKWMKTISAATDQPVVVLMERALREFVERYQAQRKFGQS